MARNIGKNTKGHVIVQAGVDTLCQAVQNESSDMVEHLFDETNVLRADGWTDERRVFLLLICLKRNMFGIARKIREVHTGLQVQKENGERVSVDENVAISLAGKPNAFVEKSSNFLWRSVTWVLAFLYPTKGNPKKDNDALELLRIVMKAEYLDALFHAARVGNTEFIAELIHKYPHLIEKVNNNKNKYTIFHIAVIYRRVGIYNLLHVIDPTKKKNIISLKDESSHTMLHLVCQPAKTEVDMLRGTYEMLSDILWFKEVDSMFKETDEDLWNKLYEKETCTPLVSFTKHNEFLAKESDKCMKRTASHCMVVAALFYAVVFAAAFAVPGGYNQTNGIPILKSKATFMVFVVAIAISLFSSVASIGMFLSIFISDYAKPDLLQSLKKLMLGLATLFLSATTTTITFSVSFFVLYHKHLIWVPALVTLFGVMPIFLFAWLICPRIANAYRLTYGSAYLFRTKKQPKCKPFFMRLFSKCT